MKLAVGLCLLVFAASPVMAIDFDTEVRPILSEHCFQCHGPDGGTREADLRLDTRSAAFADLGGYAAFKAGDIENSEALQRVMSEDPDLVMPPPHAKIPLSDAQKQTLLDWVESGASWSKHWAFVTPKRPDTPSMDGHWGRNPIDHFIATKAQAAGLNVGNVASSEALIRRVTLDLTGLPPTPEEVDAFLADTSDDAYERVVDRLLASPRYGERMAWEWMDAARYADTDGFQGDPTRTMWPWRDWLVKALNDNMPFDQFTIEMLAGDLLENATEEQVLATGFNRNHMFNGEGGRIPEETRIENVFDRAETTSTVWLGLTMTCCRCHDHKFDPISMEEYFKFFAFFNNTSENGRSGRGKTAPVIDYLGLEDRLRRDELKQHIEQLTKRLLAPDVALDAEQSRWESETIARLGDTGASQLGRWSQLGPIEASGQKAFDEDLGPEEKVDLDASYGAHRWVSKVEQKDGVVVELPKTIGATYFYRSIESPSNRQMTISLGSDDAIKVFLNGKELLAKLVYRAAAADQEIVTLDLEKGHNELLIKIVNTGNIGGFYFRKTAESQLGLPADIVTALTAAKRNATQQTKIREHFRSKHWEQWLPLAKQRKARSKQLDQINARVVKVMVMDDLKKARETRMLERGGYDKPTDQIVSAGTPSVLPPLGAAKADRLSLAKWLVDPSHPLTARVTVNRYWQTFFGKGLVKSTEDFGVQGSRPTHPRLLDWLAVQFIESGWNVKEMHKLIVMSATYRQPSDVSAEALHKDPENTFYTRAPRFRLPSWMLRDQALAVSGLMNDAIGGPPVKTYQPEGIWAEATFGKIRFKPDAGDKLYRRSLYVFWRRIVGPTMFFDGAKRQTCEVKPTWTNTPLHALTTLNETTYVESARAMAERILGARSTAAQRIELAFRMVTGRSPSDTERSILERRVALLQSDFGDDPQAATRLLGVGDSQRETELDVAEHAAYALVCSILLNLDETLCRP
ncbi:MAG: PSD1 and planctomycete cytochrome C domain-containing protein [Planctomycetota bacterium]